MEYLRKTLIRLAHEVPEIRCYLVPLLQRTATWNKSPTMEGARDLFEEYRRKYRGTKKTFLDFYEPTKKIHRPSVPKLVTPKENKLPELATQKTKSWGELHRDAQDAHEHQLDWLNRGKGIDRTLGAKVIRADKNERVDWSERGPVIVIGPLKNEKSAKEKIETRYDGDWSLLTDVVRASIGVDRVNEIPVVIKSLRKSGMQIASKPRNRFSTPTIAGYRDLIYQIEYPNGHIGEIQIHLKSMLLAKEKGHALYERTRAISAQAKKEGRDTLTDEEIKTLKEINETMKDIYTRAWQEGAEMNIPRGKRAGTNQKTEYFNWDGIPAQWEYRKFPVQFLKGQKKVVYELYTFFHEAVRITEEEFKKLKNT